MLDLDDILPTMLVCRQFFACKHLTILCKDLSGFILGNLKDYSLDDMKRLNGICANNIIFVVVFKVVRSALRSVVQNSPKCPACIFLSAQCAA